MSSFNRNTRRANSLLCPRALGAVLGLTVMSGPALAGGAHQFVFTAYTNAAGGAEVMAGRYHAALEELTGYPGTMDAESPEVDTNRCVAYSMTLQWHEARAACDAAVREATQERDISPAWWSWAPAPENDYLALAYANRAVMYWLSEDGAAAKRDLARAQELSPRAHFVAQNVAALKAHRAVALAAASSPKS